MTLNSFQKLEKRYTKNTTLMKGAIFYSNKYN